MQAGVKIRDLLLRGEQSVSLRGSCSLQLQDEVQQKSTVVRSDPTVW